MEAIYAGSIMKAVYIRPSWRLSKPGPSWRLCMPGPSSASRVARPAQTPCVAGLAPGLGSWARIVFFSSPQPKANQITPWPGPDFARSSSNLLQD